MPSSLHRAIERVGAEAASVLRERKPSIQPSRALLLAKVGRWMWAEAHRTTMSSIIPEADFSDDPAFVYPFKTDQIQGLRGRGKEGDCRMATIQSEPKFPKGGCTVLVREAVFNLNRYPAALK